MGTSMAAAAAAAVLALLRLAASPAFVPGCSGFPSKSVPLTVSGPAALQEGCLTAASRSEASSQSGVAVGIAAVALLAAAASRRSQHSSASRGGAKSLAVKAVLYPEPLLAASTASAFAGGSLHEEATAARSRVALKANGSLNCCDKLYFRKFWTYKKRHQKNLRNRAFNMIWRNRYKKQMKKVLRFGDGLEYGDSTPASLDEVMSNVKELLDEACETIDFISVQGLLHRNIAFRRKDRMCRRLLRGCLRKEIVKKPEDPWTMAHEVLGYKMPKCYAVREPRPWQLPGWKSPWMLREEFRKWEMDTGRAFQKK